jgi:hypothetical protein
MLADSERLAVPARSDHKQGLAADYVEILAVRAVDLAVAPSAFFTAKPLAVQL